MPSGQNYAEWTKLCRVGSRLTISLSERRSSPPPHPELQTLAYLNVGLVLPPPRAAKISLSERRSIPPHTQSCKNLPI